MGDISRLFDSWRFALRFWKGGWHNRLYTLRALGEIQCPVTVGAEIGANLWIK